ncbi:MAG TPA: ATP-dependent DNA helicase UvrD2 [Candidatus Limnocylindrales bacterium]
MPTVAQPDALLADLNTSQHEAVLATDGPVAILAGAGTGKTRVISRRTAYAIRTGVVAADEVLVLAFTDKAAAEMAERLAGLGLPGVTARTFHSHALSQLRHFWPSRHDGAPVPAILDSKFPILVPIARALPGNYRFTAAKDLADEIEWAKSRRITAAEYERAARQRTPPLPADLMARVYADYETAKARTNRLDFDDMLIRTVELLETDDEAAETVRARKRWFSVDEYQDTNPLQERLLELWLGDRQDICVVGDEDQTIYSFTGATSDFLTGFADRHPGARVVTLTENYRSTPQVLDLANRLLAAQGRTKELVATRPDGPKPTIEHHAAGEAELVALASRVRGLIAAGTAPSEIAVLVRINAHLVPIEEALTRAGVAYVVRGVRFYERPDVRAAIDLVKKAKLDTAGSQLPKAVRDLWGRELGYEEGATGAGEAGERAAAFDTLLAILAEFLRAQPAAGASAWLAELDARRLHERAGSADGVNLLTYHRAKGLEWDAVFLPMLEEGTLPIRQAGDEGDGLAEERRLLYVGITRARTHVALSWAEKRESRGKESRRKPSRFLVDLAPQPPRTIKQLPDRFGAPVAQNTETPLFAALREWRAGRARAEGVPAYVVAHDQTLSAIADLRPSTMPALRRIHGMGPSKLDRYGAEILALVAADRAVR